MLSGKREERDDFFHAASQLGAIDGYFWPHFGLKSARAFSARCHPWLINPLEVFATFCDLSIRHKLGNGARGGNAGLDCESQGMRHLMASGKP